MGEAGTTRITPSADYKWNNLGGLYESFYKEYENYSLQELCSMFEEAEQKIIKLTESYTSTELFKSGAESGPLQHLLIGQFGNGFTLILLLHLNRSEVK